MNFVSRESQCNFDIDPIKARLVKKLIGGPKKTSRHLKALSKLTPCSAMA